MVEYHILGEFMKIVMNDKKMTVKEGIERFLHYTNEKHLVEDTIKDYYACCKYFLNWLGEDVYCADINNITFENYRYFLKTKKLANATVNNYLRHIKVAINYFIEKGWTTYFKMKLDKRIKVKKISYTNEEMEKLLKSVLFTNIGIGLLFVFF